MKHEWNSFPQEVLETFLRMLKSLKKFFLENKSKTNERVSTNAPDNLSKIPRAKDKPAEIFVAQSNESTDADIQRELMIKELKFKAVDMHYLLDATAIWLNVETRRYTRESAEILVKKWTNTLSVTKCRELADKFSTLNSITNTDEEIISIWWDFLTSLGLNQFAAQDEEITLTPENRGFFDNGQLYDDGKRLFINKYPWFLNGELLIRGEFYWEDE